VVQQWLCVLCALARFNDCFSRRGAETAKNFNVAFVLTLNTFACFAPWREYICFFSLAKAPRPQRTSMFDLFLPQELLRALRLSEILYIFSLAKTPRTPGISMLL
jgi:hypothetical protein